MRYGISDEVNENMVQCEKAHNVKAVIRLEVAGFSDLRSDAAFSVAENLALGRKEVQNKNRQLEERTKTRSLIYSIMKRK